MNAFRGTGVAIVTPFNEDATIDWGGLRNLIQHLTEGGVNYLVVLGTTGENVTLSFEEKQEVFSFVAKENYGKLPLVAGVGGNYTQAVLDQLRRFTLTGYSAILSVSPYYNKPNQNGIYAHYKAISEASPLPIIMYNVPGRTGMNVTAATTLRIATDFKNIIATKEASGNMEQIMQIAKNKSAGFEIISGDDNLSLPMIALGSIGTISVVANAYPKQFSSMIDLALRGDFAAARPIHESLIDITNSMFEEGNPSGVKAYLSFLNVCKNAFRLPVVTVSEELMQQIKIHMAGLK